MSLVPLATSAVPPKDARAGEAARRRRRRRSRRPRALEHVVGECRPRRAPTGAPPVAEYFTRNQSAPPALVSVVAAEVDGAAERPADERVAGGVAGDRVAGVAVGRADAASPVGRGRAAVTVTTAVSLACAPLLSVTVSVAVYVPDARVGVRRRHAGSRRAVAEAPRVARDRAVRIGRSGAVEADGGPGGRDSCRRPHSRPAAGS